jgi:FkbM family methyltransferase
MKIIHRLFKNNSTLINLFEKLLGAKIFTTLPVGIDLSLDIKYNLKSLEINTIFDVGANIGESENYFSKCFPRANIYCFEPIPSSFDRLKKNIMGHNSYCFNFGFGEISSVNEIFTYENPNLSSYNSINSSFFDNEIKKKEQIELKTLSNFCSENNINHIDILKIDTEGFDLKVLLGAKELLEKGKISIIQVEASMSLRNDFHIYFEEFIKLLKLYNFEIFGIYDQTLDFKLLKPILRRTNITFVNYSIL